MRKVYCCELRSLPLLAHNEYEPYSLSYLCVKVLADPISSTNRSKANRVLLRVLSTGAPKSISFYSSIVRTNTGMSSPKIDDLRINGYIGELW